MMKTPRSTCQLGVKIRELRKAKGWTQEQLAKAVGVSTNFIGYVERGVRKPSLNTLERIARALGVATKDLFESLDDEDR